MDKLRYRVLNKLAPGFTVTERWSPDWKLHHLATGPVLLTLILCPYH